MTMTASGLSLTSSRPPFCQDIIRASWRRCISEYRLDPSDRRGLACVPPQTLNVLHSEMLHLLSDTSTIIEQVRKVAREAGYIVLISNPDGVIVRTHADSTVSQDILRQGFALGSILHEQEAGTNGIGTCIASRQPITIHADAHFYEGYRGFTCSAAPVLGSDGTVLAALDMSGHVRENSDAGNFARYFIRDAANLMSLMLFRKRHMKDCIVSISQRDDAFPLPANALVATDESGRIIGATAEGYSCLGASDLQGIAGRTLQDFCSDNVANLKPHSKHSVTIHTANGSLAYATAFVNEKLAATPVRRQRPAPLASPLDRIAGSDPAGGEIVKLCRKLLNSDIPILLLGETGVGKDTMARGIHAESARADKPYIAFNCAAIPAALLASELFGYAPGTFTDGAKGGKTGKIAASDGGTLFLDEIGDMPLDLQAHLLRVLEDRAVNPLGSTRTDPVNLKIICATHRNLPELVRSGQFRKDLYYRIRGAQFTIPALRHRSDFATLAASVLREEIQLDICRPVELGPEALDRMQRYPWPGNIRELRNVIRLVLSLLGNERLIKIDHLPGYLLEFTDVESMTSAAHCRSEARELLTAERDVKQAEDKPARESLRYLTSLAEREQIVIALRAHLWSITNAANELGISRATLHRKIRIHAISAPLRPFAE